MPYIEGKNRKIIDDSIGTLDLQNPGELNYLLTKICLAYLSNNRQNYQSYNDIIGALESSKLEFYRRQVVEYENRKIKENGDLE